MPNPLPNPVFLCFFNIKWIICPKKYDIWTYHMISWPNFNIMGGFGTFWTFHAEPVPNPCRTRAEPCFFCMIWKTSSKKYWWCRYHVISCPISGRKIVPNPPYDEPLCRTLCRTLFCYVFLTWYGSHTQRIMVYVKIMWYHGQNPINYVQSKLRGPVCEFCLTNVNLSGNYKQWRARDLKFLVHLEKLVESCGLRFGVMSKMRDFTQPSICLLKTQI